MDNRPRPIRPSSCSFHYRSDFGLYIDCQTRTCIRPTDSRMGDQLMAIQREAEFSSLQYKQHHNYYYAVIKQTI